MAKVRAAVIAYRLERANTKAQLLDAYSNSVHLGAGAYGVERASRVYFGRTARGLTLAQASLLAGLIQAPSALDPFVAPEAARRRQRHVLQAMVRNGYASPAEAAAVLASPLELRNGPVLGPVIGVVFRPPSGGPSLTLLAIVCVLAALAVTTVVSGVALIAVLLDRPLTSRTLITGGTLLLAVTLAAVAEESVGFV